MRTIGLAVVCLLMVEATSRALAQPAGGNRGPLEQLMQGVQSSELVRMQLGLSSENTPIACLISPDDLNYHTPRCRILLIGGLDGSPASVEAVIDSLRWFHSAAVANALRDTFCLSAVPCANPEGLAGGTGIKNAAGGNLSRPYPPAGPAYGSATRPEAHYLWRWIGMHAPDLVVDVRSGQSLTWRVARSEDSQLKRLSAALSSASGPQHDDELASQLVRARPCEVGTMSALQVEVPTGAAKNLLPTLLAALQKAEFKGPSPARREIQKRLDRTAIEVARELSVHYGHELNRVQYIPAVALVGRIRYGELTGEPAHLADVERIVAPYFDGQKPSLPSQPSGSDLSGHLIFAELARVTRKDRYVQLTRVAADLGFDGRGQPKEAMPAHLEMSDAVFMGCPILAHAGQLTGEAGYFEMCLRHMRFMLKLNLRPDGLHRHSPLDETAWGRGNGFPALGLALSLSALPADHPGREEMLRAYRSHLAALRRHQDATGCWHQVVDLPGSYRELSCTCMITFAIVRGLRSGWLMTDEYEPVVKRAWPAIRARVAADGGLVDVCTGTGKQKSLRDYLDRVAILGKDPRGGAMALLVATEIAAWEAERSK
jgi:rhamnogalacturonyl hydrolase YesR